MVTAFLMCVAMAGQGASPARDLSANLKAYQDARAKAGRTAADQVQLALWCEAHGLAAERLKHLTRAVLIDGGNPTARGLLGQVSYKGRWVRPDEVQAAIDADPDAQATLREYLDRRAHTSDTADAHQRLAQWCDQNGLTDQASAHYKAVLRIDPGREAVWKKLGYRKDNGRWIRPEELAAERAEAEEQKHADARWKSRLEKYRDGLLSKKEAKRNEAEAALADIDDPTAIRMVWVVFVRDDARLQRRAAQIFAQVDGPSASQSLAALALMSDYPEVRGRSAELLARRDARDYLDDLIGLIHKPLRYKVVPVNGPGSTGGIFVEGERFNYEKDYQVGSISPWSLPPRIFADCVPLLGGVSPITLAGLRMAGIAGGGVPLPSSPVSIPGMSQPVHAAATSAASGMARSMFMNAVQRDFTIFLAIQAQQQSVLQAQERERADVAAIEQTNQGVRSVNERVLPLVKVATGQDFGADPEAWNAWWVDQLGYAYKSSSSQFKPTYTDVATYTPVPIDYSPPNPYDEMTSFLLRLSQGGRFFGSSCFAAGTPVHTIAGPRPIESIQIGDRVLSQDATTGAISYQPVLVIHQNPPVPLLRLSLGTETVLATGIHRFWKVGKGWTMARELKPGDVVRTLGGSLALQSTEPAGTAPVFNLDVAENRDFFVGESGFLVYDFSIVQPVDKPFDAPAVSATP